MQIKKGQRFPIAFQSNRAVGEMIVMQDMEVDCGDTDIIFHFGIEREPIKGYCKDCEFEFSCEESAFSYCSDFEERKNNQCTHNWFMTNGWGNKICTDCGYVIEKCDIEPF